MDAEVIPETVVRGPLYEEAAPPSSCSSGRSQPTAPLPPDSNEPHTPPPTQDAMSGTLHPKHLRPRFCCPDDESLLIDLCEPRFPGPTHIKLHCMKGRGSSK